MARTLLNVATFTDAAIAVHHTATEDSEWDASAAVAAMPNTPSVLKYCHAWQDGTGSDVKEDYKFPHHRKQGGPANIPACRNGLARLANSSIPESDKAGVKAHLQAHIDDHNKSNGDGRDNAMGQKGSLAALLTKRTEARKNLVQGKPTAKWYEIQARVADPSTVDIMINGEIGWDIDAGTFARAMAQPEVVGAANLNVTLNSIGGDVFDGIAIYNALVAHGGQVTVTVTGLAASIASVIAMAGHKVIMGRGAEMMIHDAHAVQVGNAADMRTMADLLDRTSDNIAGFYAERSGQGDVASWRAIMQEERWYNGEQAVAAGLADEVAAARQRSDDGMDDLFAARPAARRSAALKPAPEPITDLRRPIPVPTELVDAFTLPDDAQAAFADAMGGLGAELLAQYGPPAVEDTPIDGLGDAIRSAVAFEATNVSEPQAPPVDEVLPELQYDHLADIRRAVKEGSR